MSSKEPVEIHPFERTSLDNLAPPGDFRPKPYAAFMEAQAAKAAAESYMGDDPDDELEPPASEGDSPKESATENVASGDSPSQPSVPPSEPPASAVTEDPPSQPIDDAGTKKTAAKKIAPPLSK